MNVRRRKEDEEVYASVLFISFLVGGSNRVQEMKLDSLSRILLRFVDEGRSAFGESQERKWISLPRERSQIIRCWRGRFLCN